jgi:hypothetical protein
VRKSVTGDVGTWSTVDGPFAQGAAQAVCSDSQGSVYVSGSMFITTQAATKRTAAQGYYAWITRKSSDGGNTWSTVDTYSYSGALNQTASAQGSGTDSLGNVVVVGFASDALGQGHWIVRTHAPSGWHTIDDFAGARAGGVATDAAGSLLVTGSANDSTGTHWIVRRLAAQ